MVTKSNLQLTPEQVRHQKVMRHVLSKLQDTPYVLKGGTALLFTRGLDRHSTDLDFDTTKKLNIGGRIQEGLKEAGVEPTSFKLVKDTDEVQRFKIHYREKPDEDPVFLKIETKVRENIDQDKVETVNGIQTYSAGTIFDQKIEAAGDRTKPRDLYDLAHLVRTHGHELNDAQVKVAGEFTNDIDKVADLYRESFNSDEVLHTRGDVDGTVLAFRDDVELLANSRKPSQHPVGGVGGVGVPITGTALATARQVVDAIEDPVRRAEAEKQFAQLRQAVVPANTPEQSPGPGNAAQATGQATTPTGGQADSQSNDAEPEQ